MTIALIMFYLFMATAALSGLSLIFIRNVFHGALLLIVCLLAIAGLYVLALAEFIAITQILIYAGGILVVIIFGIMLTTRLGDKPLQVTHGNWFSGVLAGVSVGALLIYFLSGETFEHPQTADKISTDVMLNTIGTELMTSYMIPFEVAGVLLLMALIGAAVTAASAKYNKS